MRSGITSIARSRLNVKNAPVESDPEITAPGAKQHESLGDERKEGKERDVQRALPVRCERPGEDGVRGTRTGDGAASLLRKDLTTLTPAIDSSATVATSASDCWTLRSTGWETRLYRYAVIAITGAIASATNASCQL
jgi:hypothetical protein